MQAAEPGRQVPETLKVLVVPEPAESLRSWCPRTVSGTLLTHVLGTVPKCGNPWILWIWFLPTVFCRVSVATPRSSACVVMCTLGAKVQAPGSTCSHPRCSDGAPQAYQAGSGAITHTLQVFLSELLSRLPGRIKFVAFSTKTMLSA